MRDKAKAFFVYGTLMPGHSRWHIMQELLKGQAYELRPALTQGTMYNLGHYPAVTLGNDGEIHGILVIPTNMKEEFMKVLDFIEGVDSGLYDRKEIDVFFADKKVHSYIYVYHDATLLNTSDVIADGIWRGA